jgi:hypothetical protein
MLVLLGMRWVYINVVCNVIFVAYTPEAKDLAVPNPRTPKASGRSLCTRPLNTNSHPC